MVSKLPKAPNMAIRRHLLIEYNMMKSKSLLLEDSYTIPVPTLNSLEYGYPLKNGQSRTIAVSVLLHNDSLLVSYIFLNQLLSM